MVEKSLGTIDSGVRNEVCSIDGWETQ